MRETEKKMQQCRKLAIAHVRFCLFCYISTTVAHLLLDDIKQAAAHFDPILCFQDTKNC